MWRIVPAVTLVLGVLTTVVVIGTAGGLTVVFVLLTPLVGWSFTIAGMVVWARRPRLRTGPLMAAAGLAWFVHLLTWTHAAPWALMGQALNNLYVALVGHLLLAYPTGRLRTRPLRALVALGYADVLGVHAARTLLPPGPVATMLATVELAVGLGLLVAGAAVLAGWWRPAGPVERHGMRSHLLAGGLAGVALAANMLSVWLAPGWQWPLFVLFTGALAAVPLAFLAGLLDLRLRRAAVADLLTGNGRDEHLAAGLARALRDPSLQVAYRVTGQDRFVDVQGRPVVMPAEGDRQTASLVRHDGDAIGAVIHDRALLAEPELLDAVAAAGLTLRNRHLHAELRARLAELQASRVRLVEAAAAERRRIERNLHDGAQQQLVSVAMGLALLESRLDRSHDTRTVLAEARAGLTTALNDLRRLSQGIHPAILSERGLRAAVSELAWSFPVPVTVRWSAPDRLPHPVEPTAYYVISEALANAAKHARATAVSVEVTAEPGEVTVVVRDDGAGGANARGAGLSGLADRVETLDGTMTIISRPGTGTTVQAVLPCA
ncbi:histidine kinase [Nonomuraea fuscirosea]|uniref:ATP-binding protein n=1 Tax=Nonomuraea fuscirosea TaxID=1291556 RepID=UPI002DD83205|nr:ATP-binding protein [Nonomuraea fuscirosea]WSA56895.1 histidine kinase [Nonomuraea fuscirosea]